MFGVPCEFIVDLLKQSREAALALVRLFDFNMIVNPLFEGGFQFWSVLCSLDKFLEFVLELDLLLSRRRSSNYIILSYTILT